MKILLEKVLIAITVLSFYLVKGQVGIGTATPNANAVLDVTSPSKGIGFPQLSTLERDAIVLPANGLTLYNTTLDCFQTNTGTPSNPNWRTWLGKAVVASYLCNTASAGNMIVGEPVVGVTQTITVNVTTIGVYTISATNNGVTFAASGTFLNTGNQDIVLVASGTPLLAAATPYSYILNTTPNCSFSRVVTDRSTNGSARVLSYLCSTATSGTLLFGSNANGATQTITADVVTPGTYSISTTVNGVTFSNSGTFSGTGLQNIVLHATGTPDASGIYDFPLNTLPSCTFTRTIHHPSTNGTGIVTDYTCTTASKGTLVKDYPIVTGVSQTLTANVAASGTYNISALANGTTFSASGTFTATGLQTIVLTANGTPTVTNTNNYVLNTTPNCTFSRVVFGTVSSSTSKIWLDRNLGAVQVATSITDTDSYGDLYQWGRLEDGHQKRSSVVTNITSSVDIPSHGNFIASSNGDWRNPLNNNLWQGVSGINNPCPYGFRLPTSSELNSERVLFTTQNQSGAFNSVLKLPRVGYRNNVSGSVVTADGLSYYWTSSINGSNSVLLALQSSSAIISYDERGYGYAVRCIKD